jgi:hypothetical protein
MKNLLHQLARALVFNQLKKIKIGHIVIIEGGNKFSFGKNNKYEINYLSKLFIVTTKINIRLYIILYNYKNNE